MSKVTDRQEGYSLRPMAAVMPEPGKQKTGSLAERPGRVLVPMEEDGDSHREGPVLGEGVQAGARRQGAQRRGSGGGRWRLGGVLYPNTYDVSIDLRALVPQLKNGSLRVLFMMEMDHVEASFGESGHQGCPCKPVL